MHGHKPKAVICPAFNGIQEEADEVAGDVADMDILDAALIAAAQAAEHCEITRYGSLISWAKRLGREDCISVLTEALREGKVTDSALMHLADAGVNERAA